MKYDRTGGASARLVAAIAELRPRLDLVAVVPSTENSRRAPREPCDVIAVNGRRSKHHTDADGRLILRALPTRSNGAEHDVDTPPDLSVTSPRLSSSRCYRHDDAFAAALSESANAAASCLGASPSTPIQSDEVTVATSSNLAAKRAGGTITDASFSRFRRRDAWAHRHRRNTAWDVGRDDTGSAIGFAWRAAPHAFRGAERAPLSVLPCHRSPMLMLRAARR